MTVLRVLHVEDEPDIREVVDISLGLDPDFETRSCSSGEEALTFLTEWTPDIILLDVMMPVMDGPATLGRLRENTKTAGIPVVFMTARAQASEIDRFRSLGAAGVIPKPFDPMTLAASVRSYVPQIVAQLGALRGVFMERINDDATMLRRHRLALVAGAVLPEALSEVRDIAHGLAGAGGIFGYSEISNFAVSLEEATTSKLNGPASFERIVRALDNLLQCIETSIATTRGAR